MINENLLNFYTSHINGEDVCEEVYNHNKAIIDYFLEAGISGGELLEALVDTAPTEDGRIEKDALMTKFLKETLIENNVFYFHKELILSPKLPAPGEKYTYYKEPKIVYTSGQALEYFYNKFKINKGWANEKQDLGGLKFLLEEYKRFDFVKPIDFFLHLVDYVEYARSLFELRNFEIEFAEIMQRDIKNARLCGLDKYTWRN